MDLTSTTTHTLTFTDEEKVQIAQALSEALNALSKKDAAGEAYNWRSNPEYLRDLRNHLDPASPPGGRRLPQG